MNREDFIDTLRKQYADEVHEAYIECENELGRVDLAILAPRIAKLRKAARAEGLPEDQFLDLVLSTLPPDVGSQLQRQIGSFKKVA